MKWENMLLAAILIFAVLGIAYSLYGFFNAGIGQNVQTDVKSLGFSGILTGTTDSGDVAIELTPIAFENDGLIVAFSANTHSVALEGFDLGKITTLEYDGKSIKPSSAAKMSGHHVNSQLVFDIDKMPTTFAIKIAGIPKVEERIFKF